MYNIDRDDVIAKVLTMPATDCNCNKSQSTSMMAKVFVQSMQQDQDTYLSCLAASLY